MRDKKPSESQQKAESDKVVPLPVSWVQGSPLETQPSLENFTSLPLTSKRLGLPVDVWIAHSAWKQVMDEVKSEAEAFGIKQVHLEHVVELAYWCTRGLITERVVSFLPGYCDGSPLFLCAWNSDGMLFIDDCPENQDGR